MGSLRVVGIGSVRVEHLAVVDRFPEAASRVDLAGYSPQWGGTVATALSALAQLGVQSRFISKVGDDHFGSFVLHGCSELGIDTSHIVRQPARISPAHFVIVDAATRRHTVLSTPGNVSTLEPDDVDLSALDGAKILAVDGCHTQVQIAAAEYARVQGIHVVLQANHLEEGMGELMALAHTLIASERCASEIAPRGELEDSLVEISQLGPETVVVKLGQEGSIGLYGEKLVRQPPLAVEVLDTTGAGDVFLGGYLCGLVNDQPLERCIQLASATAGLSCRKLGAIGGLPDLQEVEDVV